MATDTDEAGGREALLRAAWERALGWALALVLGMALAWAITLTARQPPGQPIQLLPPPTPPPLVVHVACAVVAPGVYALPPGSRVSDAVQAAGGTTPDAAEEALNLAAPLKDGQYICVPFRGTPTPGPVDNAASPGPNDTASASQRLNINTADEAQLETLPGIGPALAQRIVAYRETHGPFAKVDDLLAVSGIGPTLLGKLRPLVTTGTTP